MTRKLLIALSVALGLAGCCGCGSKEERESSAPPPAATAPMEAPAKAAPAARKTVYTCPMHPDVKSDKPGKCPKCGMDLVEKK